MGKWFFCFLVVVGCVSCSRYPADVEAALRQAGDNRPELEKVLVHYSEKPEDSLKLLSAYFLIANMPYHYTVRDARMEAFKIYLKEVEIDRYAWTNFKEQHRAATGRPEIEPDILYVTSEYLIRNIDFSFKIWQEASWGKEVSFETFCEEILPYRLSHETLEYWKEEFHATFQPFIDSIDHGNRLDDICKHLLKNLNNRDWEWGDDFLPDGFGATILLYSRFGGCMEQAELVAYMLRSVGIPSGIDVVVQPPDRINQNHYWNYTHTLDGALFGFEMSENYLINGRWATRKVGKVSRKFFSLQKESPHVKYRNRFISKGGLWEILHRDVSSEYFPDTHITVHLDAPGRIGRKSLASLCVFNNREWVPVAYIVPKKGLAEFRHVEPDILYQIRLIGPNENRAGSKPFILLDNENAQFLDADMDNLQSMTLVRKYKLPPEWPFYVHRAVGGRFQGANRADFRDSVTLHAIQNPANFRWVDVIPSHHDKFRYVRYISSPNAAHNHMAEMQFYAEGKRLSGEIIGTDSSQVNLPTDNKYAAFDDDPLTYFYALYPNDAWAGLKLEQPYHIDGIRYIFRNDDNNVRVGDTYELLYQRRGEWISTGRQIADTTLLHYENVPSNTLYWLRNHTRGREERPFIYENGHQMFY